MNIFQVVNDTQKGCVSGIAFKIQESDLLLMSGGLLLLTLLKKGSLLSHLPEWLKKMHVCHLVCWSVTYLY